MSINPFARPENDVQEVHDFSNLIHYFTEAESICTHIHSFSDLIWNINKEYMENKLDIICFPNQTEGLYHPFSWHIQPTCYVLYIQTNTIKSLFISSWLNVMQNCQFSTVCTKICIASICSVEIFYLYNLQINYSWSDKIPNTGSGSPRQCINVSVR